jgi:hypothetical protein
MNAESLKISLTQRILSINDLSVLEKIDQFLSVNNIIGYDSNGQPISAEEYRADLDIINNDIDNGNAQLFSPKEVKRRIIDANNLV